MNINKETYENFFATINKEINRIENVISHYDMENPADYSEAEDFYWEIEQLQRVAKFFSDTTRLMYCSIEELESYVEKSKTAYDSLTRYIETVLPENGGELSGISYKDFDKIEGTRWTLGEQVRNWTMFLHFCKTGEIK